MVALMAGHIENGDKGGSGARRAVQPIIPVLPLRPVKKGAQLIPQQKPAQIKNGVSNGLLSGGFERPDHTIRIQLGELEGDHEQVAHSPALSNQTGSSMDAAPSPLPSGMFVPRQLSMLKAQKVLSDASNNDTLTQATSSRPSSTSPTFNLASVDPTSESKLQPPVVELPPDAYISRSASLKISFLYQEDLDSASSTITPHSRSPTISAFPEMSPAPIGAGMYMNRVSELSSSGNYHFQT